MNSNWTLRFPRSSREAYGYQIGFESEHKLSDYIVFAVMLFALGLVLGFSFGA